MFLLFNKFILLNHYKITYTKMIKQNKFLKDFLLNFMEYIDNPTKRMYNLINGICQKLRRKKFMLELKNISFEVSDEKGTKEIIKDLNLKIDDGKFVVITGPNGSGKSTTAKIIAGIEQPVSGNIYLDGKDITNKTITERANAGISFAFQQPVRFKGITVLDLLKLASKKQLTPAEAGKYLEMVGLRAKDYIRREVNSSLSGGELKRIEIATVLARETKLSIFDEPEAGIDLWSFQNLIQVFKHMRETTKGSILIISHQERILEIADEIILLSDGTVVKQGTKEEILPELLKKANEKTALNKPA